MGFTLLPKGSKGPWKAWINKLMLLWCTQITSIISLLIGGEGFTYMRPHMMCDQSYISPLHQAMFDYRYYYYYTNGFICTSSQSRRLHHDHGWLHAKSSIPKITQYCPLGSMSKNPGRGMVSNFNILHTCIILVCRQFSSYIQQQRRPYLPYHQPQQLPRIGVPSCI